MSSLVKINRALISVTNKDGIIELAKILQRWQVEILSTGGTATLLREHHIPVIEVSDYTGFPEIMAGRVKTLHPKVHGGLLGRRGMDDAVMAEHGIEPIDLLVVNLYAFQDVIAEKNCSRERAIEHIDIGGPAMLRAACKNHQHVTVVTDPNDYKAMTTELEKQSGSVALTTRQRLAAKGFALTASYDTAVANYLADSGQDAFPAIYQQTYRKQQDLRYGENPHQQAAFYVDPSDTSPSIATAKQCQGKALSFNNIADADAALECVKAFTEPACVIVKHANPCGVAVSKDGLQAYQRAFATDSTSAFGGIIAFNRTLDGKIAQAILDKQFVEVIVAPEVTDDAKTILQQKPNIRLLICGQWPQGQQAVQQDSKRIRGGLLVQDSDEIVFEPAKLQVVSKKQPSQQEYADCLFAWTVAKFIKSNAIIVAKDGATVGIGAGQMSRVISTRIASIKAEDAGLSTQGAVLASDAFFPFADNIDYAKAMGVTALIQPGGSMRDKEVIAAADEAGMAMIVTGMRHFKH